MKRLRVFLHLCDDGSKIAREEPAETPAGVIFQGSEITNQEPVGGMDLHNLSAVSSSCGTPKRRKGNIWMTDEPKDAGGTNNRQMLENFIQDGWYAIEEDGNNAWVWSTQRSSLNIPPETQYLDLHLTAIYPELKRTSQNLKIFLNGELYREYQIADKYRTVRIKCDNADSMLFEVDAVRPSDCIDSQDSRLLGICLLKIECVMPDSCFRASFRSNLDSGGQALDIDPPYDLDIVSELFTEAGYPPVDLDVDLTAFNEYLSKADYRGHDYGTNLAEKCLEHFVSTKFTPLNAESRVIDIANNTSKFPKILNRIYHCNVWSNDLIFAPGANKVSTWHTRIGGDACSLPVPDDFFDLATCHCAFEMFEADGDTNLIREMERVLKPGGKLVILPLYMHETFHIRRDPLTSRSPLPAVDDGAVLVYRNNFYGLAYARMYSVKAFKERVIDSLSRFTLQIFRVRNLEKIDPSCYLHWIAVFEKTS